MTLVFNASPLIVLSKAGLLETLRPLASQIQVPQSVIDEVLAGKTRPDPVLSWIERHQEFIRPDPPISTFVAAWDLGAGESAVETRD